MDANKAENVYLEKLEDDWQQIPQFADAEMCDRPQKSNEDGEYEKKLPAKCR